MNNSTKIGVKQPLATDIDKNHNSGTSYRFCQ